MAKIEIWTQGDVTCRLNRYDSGLVEIGFYTPPFLPSAGLVLRAIVSRQYGRGSKWCVYGPASLTLRYRLRAIACAKAIEVAQAEHDRAVAAIAASQQERLQRLGNANR